MSEKGLVFTAPESCRTYNDPFINFEVKEVRVHSCVDTRGPDLVVDVSVSSSRTVSTKPFFLKFNLIP